MESLDVPTNLAEEITSMESLDVPAKIHIPYERNLTENENVENGTKCFGKNSMSTIIIFTLVKDAWKELLG
jgi:hypothetical protein